EYGVPVCQNLPADPIDHWVVAAFFEALAPIELDVYARAVAAEQAIAAQQAQARRQQLERLRYEAALAERQFRRVDPENRLVAAELEGRWEAVLRGLRSAEAESERPARSEEHTSELQSLTNLVCRLLLENKKTTESY